MALRSKAKTAYIPAPAGTHTAILFALADCGLQHSERYGSESERLWVEFELANERMEDGRPYTIGQIVTNSLSTNAPWRGIVEALVGRALKPTEVVDLDIRRLLGRACLVSISHSESGGRTKAKIDSAMPLPKGTTVPPRHNDILAYDTEAPDDQVFGKLPTHVRDLIEKRIHVDEKKTAEPESSTADEDVPF